MNWYRKIKIAQVGEYWIDDMGYDLFADGDISDYNHEQRVIEAILSNYFEMDNIDAPDPYDLKPSQMAEIGMSREEIDAVTGKTDAREYGLKRLKWIRVMGNNITVQTLDSSTLKAMSTGLGNIYGEEAEDAKFNIEEYATNTMYYEVPFLVIETGKVPAVKQYKFNY